MGWGKQLASERYRHHHPRVRAESGCHAILPIDVEGGEWSRTEKQLVFYYGSVERTVET